MEENKKKINTTKVIVWVSIVAILLGVIFGVLYYITEKDDGNNLTDSDVQVISEKGKFFLEEENKKFLINGKIVTLKNIDSTLYVNDVERSHVRFEGEIFVTNEYILITQVGQFGAGIEYAVDSNGTVIDVVDETGSNKQYEKIEIVDNKVYANRLPDNIGIDDDYTDKLVKVEFINEGNKITVKARSN